MRTFSKKPFILFYFCLGIFALFSALEKTAAQPGETRSYAEIEKGLKEYLDEKSREIAESPSYSLYYKERGEIYYRLYENEQKHRGTHNSLYVENGIADFTKAVRFVNETYSPADRKSETKSILLATGRFYQTIWKYQFYRIPETAVKERLKHLYESEFFTKAESVFVKAAQIASAAEVDYFSLSQLYVERGEKFLYAPDLLKEAGSQNKTELILKDFDSALQTAQPSSDADYSERIMDVLLKKGKIAFDVGKYDVALAVYQSDEKYFGKNYESLCGENFGKSFCDDKRRRARYIFSFRRASVFVKIEQPEKALSEMEVFFASVFHTSCPEPFLLRAQAYRQLGKLELAAADEKRAQGLPPLSLGSCSY